MRFGKIALQEKVVAKTGRLDARERVRSRLMASVDRQFPDAWVRITRLELGPPVGFPVQFRVVGPDTRKVREIMTKVGLLFADRNFVHVGPFLLYPAPPVRL